MSKKNSKNRAKREVNFELAAKIILVLTVIGIIISTTLIFTPSISGEGYAELGLLTYNAAEDKYEAEGYPQNIDYNNTEGASEIISLYILLGNHYEQVKFFEVRLKIGLQSVLINQDIYGTNDTTYFHKTHWKQKVLAVGEQWIPSTETEFRFMFSAKILNQLGTSSTSYKIIFELWEWNSQLSELSYTGVHAYLTSVKLVIV